MGIRIDAYAVDIPKLDVFLDSSLASLLQRYVRDGKDTTHRLSFFVGGDSDAMFVAIPQGSIVGSITELGIRRQLVFSEQQIQTVPSLDRSAREHFSLGSIYEASCLLQAFSDCGGIDFIHRVINGHRRWWIGSVLQFAQATLTCQEYEGLLLLFRKMLRGFDCGYPICDEDVGVDMHGLPFTPEIDPDLRFGRWTESDCLAAERLLRLVVSSGPAFTRPSGQIGIAPGDSEWNEWVQGNITSLLQVSDLEYDQLNVFTFIG